MRVIEKDALADEGVFEGERFHPLVLGRVGRGEDVEHLEKDVKSKGQRSRQNYFDPTKKLF
jgi:hypothetical protein